MEREELLRQALLKQAQMRQSQMAAQNAPQPAAPEQTQRGLGARIYDNLIGNPDDGVQSTGEALGTWLNRAGESATLGVVGDEASAAVTGMLPGRSYDSELDRYRQNEENMSGAGRLSADLAGALAPGAGLLGKVAQGATAGGRALRAAGAGAAAGGLYGFMEGEGDNRGENAAWNAAAGAGFGAGASALGRLFQGALNKRASGKAIKDAARGAPTSQDLRAQGNALYSQIDNAGVQIKPEAFAKARGEITDYLRGNTGYDELPGPGSLTPNTARVMEIMKQAEGKMAAEPTAALPFKALDQMRRQAGAAAGNVANKTDQKAGVGVIQGLDDFVQRLGPDDIAAGDVEALKTAIPKAREVWQRMSKSQLIDDAMERSENYLSGSASGVRNQFKNMLQNPKIASRFTPAERAALRKVTHGGPLDQLINLAGGGLSQMAMIGGGLGFGGPVGAAVGTGAAMGARKLSEAVTMRSAEMARAAIASGQLPAEVAANPALANLLRMQLLGMSGSGGDRLSPVPNRP